MTRSYFRRADGVMLLYDVTNERSFLSVRQWIDAVDVRVNLVQKLKTVSINYMFRRCRRNVSQLCYVATN